MKRAALLLILGGAVGAAAIGGLAYLATQADRCAASPEIVIAINVSRYRYDPGTDSPIAVPLCATVVLRVTSTDVTHGLSVRGLHEDQTLIAPQATIDIRFVASKAGTFDIYCTAFCGPGHPEHKGTLHVA